MSKKPDYIQLNDDYNELASDISSITKKHEKLKAKLDDIDAEFTIYLNRLIIYIKNEFWNKYSYKKYTFLISNEKDGTKKIKFFDQKDMKIAKAKYDSEQEDKKDVLEDDFNFFCDDDLNDKKEFDNMIDFLQNNISTVKFECDINHKQENTIRKLTIDTDRLEEHYHYAKTIMQDLESEYTDCMTEIISRLENDDEYDFNIETDEIMSIRDEETMIWHLIYYRLDSDTIEDSNDKKD
jgi:hypothetical protein